MKHLIAALSLMASPALAEFVHVEAEGNVAEVTDRLEAAVQEAGATVFARVNHAEGAASVDMDLAPAELLIFGNPMLGTPAMQADIRAGLMLPLRVLVANMDGETHLIYEDVAGMMDGLDVPLDAEYAQKMGGALATLTGKAAMAQ